MKELTSKVEVTCPRLQLAGQVSLTVSLSSASFWYLLFRQGSPGGSDGKESACNSGDLSLIPGLGRSPGEGQPHSSILVWRTPMDRGAWRTAVHRVSKSWK